MKSLAAFLSTAVLAVSATGFSSAALALDVEAAKGLADQNNCMQCHGLRKDKDGPSFLSTADKYRNKASAVDEVIKHMTSGKDVKLADGTMEKHKVAKTMPANDAAQLKNLAQYILSIQPK
ncbi:MAG: c-type cytochrome [Rhodocyclaceae bacterium]|nr:c-type cytochrome [Rhodocyclaceae bacterium]MDZ4213239.1 c-type cytochrome [Rhodocyclaceae bacterium]